MSTPLTFDEFEQPSFNEWLETAEKELKGASLDQVLNWQLEEGISPDAYPEKVPLLELSRKEGNQWAIIEKITCDNKKQANKDALEALNAGATGLHFNVSFTSIEELDNILKDILFEHITCFIEVASLQEANVLKKWLESSEYSPEKLDGALLYNPLGKAASKGKVPTDYTNTLLEIAGLFSAYPTFRCLCADESIYHNAGANLTESTAFVLAEATEYLQLQVESGIDVDTASANIQLSATLSSYHLPEIARLRCLRHLWAKIVESYKPKHECSKYAYVYATNSERELALPDRHNNLLRASSQAMSAIIGGVDALHLHAFDQPSENSPFGKRIARNIQLLLEHEAFLNRETDPASGSRYIENLTVLFCKNVWDLFCEIQDVGGYTKALERNYIQWKINHSAKILEQEINEGKRKIIGVNSYPNAKETDLPKIAVSPKITEDFEAIQPVSFYAQVIKPVTA